MLTCPIPKSDYDKVLLAHGGGGKLTHQLIEKIFVEAFRNDCLNQLGDSAILKMGDGDVAFTTDSYVVNPIFFPGGNIGELAVNGTINDLSASGAKPLYISAGFIIEEGFSIEKLWEITLSMKNAAEKAGIMIVTGDTKVVEKGKGDQIFINTSGVGSLSNGISISPRNCKVGDKVILSGRIGDHGIAVMSARNNLKFESDILSDTAPLNDLTEKILKYSKEVKMMKDITRGGLSGVLNEIAGQGELGIYIEENKVPIHEQVSAACELLGLDPFYIANEGKMLVIVDPAVSNAVLLEMQEHEFGKESSIIGEIVDDHPGRVVMRTEIGSNRILDMMSGEQLPRIC